MDDESRQHAGNEPHHDKDLPAKDQPQPASRYAWDAACERVVLREVYTAVSDLIRSHRRLSEQAGDTSDQAAALDRTARQLRGLLIELADLADYFAHALRASGGMALRAQPDIAQDASMPCDAAYAQRLLNALQQQLLEILARYGVSRHEPPLGAAIDLSRFSVAEQRASDAPIHTVIGSQRPAYMWRNRNDPTVASGEVLLRKGAVVVSAGDSHDPSSAS